MFMWPTYLNRGKVILEVLGTLLNNCAMAKYSCMLLDLKSFTSSSQNVDTEQ